MRRCYFAVELSPLNELHHKIDPTISLKNLEKLRDIRMPYFFQYSHLSRYIYFISCFLDHLLIEDFNGNFLVCSQMRGLPNTCKCANSYCFANRIFSDNLLFLLCLRLLVIYLIHKIYLVSFYRNSNKYLSRTMKYLNINF